MIASLPMYDRPENAAAHDRLWALIRDALRDEGVAAPDTLTRGIDIWEGWQHPGLMLGQICGMPLREALHDRVSLIATADYGLADTPAGHYRSVLVARAGASGNLIDFKDKVLAYNDAMSHSGWAAPQLAAAKLGFRFNHYRASGGHAHSVAMIADGRADIAAIDAVSWRDIKAHDPAATSLKVIGQTDATPGLAFIAAAGTDPAPHLAAIRAAIAALHGADRATLGLRGVASIPLAAYRAVATPPAPVQRRVDMAQT